MRIVQVTWVDSCSHHGWSRRTKDDHKLLTVSTVGFRLPAPRGVVAIAQGMDENGSTDEVLTIPRVCVRRIVELVEPERDGTMSAESQ